MLVAAIVSSTLTRRIKNQAILSARKAYRTGTLLETSRKLQRARSEREIFSVAAAQLGKLLERTIVIYPANEKKGLGQMEIFPGEDGERWTREDFLAEREIAEWVFGTISMRARRLIPFPRRDVCIWRCAGKISRWLWQESF